MTFYNSVYEELERLARHRVHPLPAIVVTFGSVGWQFAAVRMSRARTLQCRVWRKSSGTWTKWRKLQPAEVVRLASDVDRAKFKPDYGPVWEENW